MPPQSRKKMKSILQYKNKYPPSFLSACVRTPTEPPHTRPSYSRMLTVTFQQIPMDNLPREKLTFSYASFDEVVAAVLAYFNERKDRFANETICMATFSPGSITKSKKFPTSKLELRLPKACEDVTLRGKTCSLNLYYGKTTVNGNVHITEYFTTNTVIISAPHLVRERDEETRRMVLLRHGRIHHCGDPCCNHDCGMLRCGCDYRCECDDDHPY